MEVGKIRGEENPADLMTKILTEKQIEERLDRMNVAYCSGRR